MIAAKSELMRAESASSVALVATGAGAGAGLVAVDPETVVVLNLARSASGLAEVPTQAHLRVAPSAPGISMENLRSAAVTLALTHLRLSSAFSVALTASALVALALVSSVVAAAEASWSLLASVAQ